MISRTSPEFWQRYHILPADIQRLADRCYRIWLANPQHPAIRFKRLNGPLYSARIGLHYRVVGYLEGDEITWVWIGSHKQYDHLRF